MPGPTPPRPRRRRPKVTIPAGDPKVATTKEPLECHPRDCLHKKGILLRDFIATEAMNGILSGLIDCSSASCDEVAERSYEYADAMLKAREPKSVDE